MQKYFGQAPRAFVDLTSHFGSFSGARTNIMQLDWQLLLDPLGGPLTLQT